ncbi:hypothetical protein AUR64_15700 [Haloprofundus marisrubri]|uniref:Uncharacterized protein n=1 Tax=Haloprofundus marisrubri TaxID=1514971 RepID=A0A0W1R7Z0_9EURY|nr:hypothetical protein [Haloprofundus marisrubri]KTG09234.1 hypothetical protein AUR64_15700 [Haloprofundus marisrubri]
MQFKLVPPAPDDLSVVADAQKAVPLVPDSEDDCCERLMRRVGFPSRDAARTWLTFLRALELATETQTGFKRLRTDPTPEHLRDAFTRRVFAAEELLAVLVAAEEPVSADEAYARVRDRVPQWEHFKNPERWEEIWGERVADILEWFVLLGLAERRDGGYVRA